MLRLTDYMLRRIAERRLLLSWIESALASSDWTGQDRDPRLMHAFKAIPEFDGRILKVVHRREGGDIVIVTAHFDRGARGP